TFIWLFFVDFFFFFQAEDGIRDGHVTGVQTCALPILKVRALDALGTGFPSASSARTFTAGLIWWSATVVLGSVLNTSCVAAPARSEERRVGKECRSRCVM